MIRPVVIFTAAQDSGTTPMIRALLSLSPNEWSQQPERFQRERDLLALQCGATGRPHDFVEDLVERRAALFPPRGMREARAIAELGDEVVPYLSHAENRKAHAGEQAACIRALALIGTSRAEFELQGYLKVATKSAAYELARYVEPLYVEKFRADFLDEQRRFTIPFRLVRRIESITPLSGVTNLEWLDLSRTQVADLSPLSGLTNLKWLEVNDTRVTDVSPLSGLQALESLDFGGTQVTDISKLSGLTTLKRLGLSKTQVADLSPLSDLTGLSSLTLSDTHVTDLSPLSNLAALERLELGDTQVSDLSNLSGLTTLKSLGGLPPISGPALKLEFGAG